MASPSRFLSMATPSTPHGTRNGNTNDNSSPSYFQKTVSLCDWWLIKADGDFNGKRLAVAGFTSREKRALRVFYSAPIAKQYDIFTLETADGIIVILQGFINKARTMENGFPDEVFSHFLFGFPPHWEEYFNQAVNSGLDFPNTGEGNGSTSEPDDTRATVCSPILTPTEPIGEKEHSVKVVEDCSNNISEMTDVDSLNGSNLLNQVRFGSFQEKSKANGHPYFLNNIPQCTEGATLPQNEFHSIVSSKPVESDERKEDTKCLPSSLYCHIKNVCAMVDNIAVQERHPSCHVFGSLGKTDDPQRNKDKEILIGKSETIASANVESVIIDNDVSEECGTLKHSNMEIHYVVNFDELLTTEASDMTQNVTKMQKKNWEKDLMTSGSMNFSSLEATKGCIDENVTCQESLPRFITGEECSTLSKPLSYLKETVEVSTVQSGPEVIVMSPTVERDSINATPRNSRHGKDHNPSRNLSDNQKPKPLNRYLLRHKAKEKVNSNSLAPVSPREKVEISEAMLRASSRLKPLSGNLETNKKSEKIVVEERGSSNKLARRQITFDTHLTPPIYRGKERAFFHTPESLSLKRSRSGRLLLPTLDFWRNQIPVYDAGRNITGIQEGRSIEQ